MGVAWWGSSLAGQHALMPTSAQRLTRRLLGDHFIEEVQDVAGLSGRHADGVLACGPPDLKDGKDQHSVHIMSRVVDIQYTGMPQPYAASETGAFMW